MVERRSDVEIVRDQLTREVTNDAAVIASQVFRRPEPDVARVTNDQIDARYRRAFAENDRQYLISEAQRDPQQFFAATQRLGIVLYPNQPLDQPVQPPRTAQTRAPLPAPPPNVLPQTAPLPLPAQPPTQPSVPPVPEGAIPPPAPTVQY